MENKTNKQETEQKESPNNSLFVSSPLIPTDPRSSFYSADASDSASASSFKKVHNNSFKSRNFSNSKYGSHLNELNVWSQIGRMRNNSMCSNDDSKQNDIANENDHSINSRINTLSSNCSQSFPNKCFFGNPSGSVQKRSPFETETDDHFLLEEYSVTDEGHLSEKCGNKLSWFYIDEQGKTQGPFSYMEMFNWFKDGLLYSELVLWRSDMQKNIILGDLVKLFGDRNPFYESDERNHIFHENYFENKRPQKSENFRASIPIKGGEVQSNSRKFFHNSPVKGAFFNLNNFENSEQFDEYEKGFERLNISPSHKNNRFDSRK